MHEALNHAKLAMLFRKEFELCNVKKGETIVLLSDLGARRDYVSAAFARGRGSRRRRLRDVRQCHAGSGLRAQGRMHSTLWRVRDQLAENGLAENVFALITSQIERSGFVLKRGTLIDASLVRSAVIRLRAARTRCAGCGWSASEKLVKSSLDPVPVGPCKDSASLGYEGSIAMDRGARSIRRALFPPNVNESGPPTDSSARRNGRLRRSL